MMGLAEEIGLVVGEPAAELCQLGLAVGMVAEEVVVRAQRVEPVGAEPRLQPSLQDLPTYPVERQAEPLLDPIGDEHPLGGFDPAHAVRRTCLAASDRPAS